MLGQTTNEPSCLGSQNLQYSKVHGGGPPTPTLERVFPSVSISQVEIAQITQSRALPTFSLKEQIVNLLLAGHATCGN